MKYALIGVIAFLIVIYAYNLIRHKKRKNAQTNTVKEFKEKYKDTSKEKENSLQGYTPYLTKYNSSVDYVEKSEFLKEINEATQGTKTRNKR